jgi:hypothetical protein
MAFTAGIELRSALRYHARMSKRMFAGAALIALVSSVTHGSGNDDAWKQLLSLAGVWEGSKDGRTATVTYTVVSGGTALMESMQMPAPEPDMVTMYHRDGDGLVATHYCSVGNQPRMRAAGASPDRKTIRFRFADITNLAKPESVHIRHLTVTFEDANHFTQEWVGSSKGKEEPAVFKWTRKTKK